MIKKNTLVSMSMKIEDENKNIIDESDEIIYLHGDYKQIFEKLEHELEGKKVGDSYKVLLAPLEAFGEYDEALVLQERLEDLPEEISVGMELDGEEDGVVYVIQSIDEEYAILNANHELAGLTLVVEGKILELQELSDEAVLEVLKVEHHEHHEH